MALVPGTRLGPYHILGQLGAGGMGEVYRARDTRLDRDVAIKVLTGQLVSSKGARERFEREARTVAALKHPNICVIHDVGDVDGVSYFVMELLEGEPLDDRLSRGHLDLRTVVDVGTALADALDAAHHAGLVHRDIKPDIFLTAHGPKILDFGLAKEGVSASSARSDQATVAPDALITDMGTTVGTPAYMSPEQLRGETLDARSDLFSLGLVLYEMATGRRVFAGDSSAAVGAAILKDQPVPPSRIRPVLPVSLDEILLKTLEKERDVRCQTASELRADLKRLKRHLESSSRVETVPVDANFKSPRRRVVAIGAGMAVAILVIAAAVFLAMRERPTPVREPVGNAFDQMRVVRLTTTGNAERPALSPDGKYMAYVQRDGARTSLWIRQTQTSSNVQIVAPAEHVELWAATITPDGNFVDFIRRESSNAPQLWRVPFLGGDPSRSRDSVWSPIGWSPDGQRIAFLREASQRGTSTLLVADAAGGQERALTILQRPATFITLSLGGRPPARPSWSPDGRTIAAAALFGSDTAGVMLIDVATGSARKLPMPGRTVALGAEWLDAGTLVLNATDDDSGRTQLWRMAVADGRLSRVTNDVTNYLGISLTADHQSVATSRSETIMSLWLGDASGNGADATAAKNEDVGDVTWEGDHVVFESSSGGTPVLRRISADKGEVRDVAIKGRSPRGTRDGRTLLYVDEQGLWKAESDGGHPVKLAEGRTVRTLASAPDDQSVIFLSNANGVQSAWVVPLDGGAPKQFLKQWVSNHGLDVSRDGKSLVVWTRDDTGRSYLVVCGYPDCSNPRSLPDAFGIPRFMPDGRSVVCACGNGNLTVLPLDGRPRYQLTHFTDGQSVVDFAWSADGRHLAISRTSASNDIVLFNQVGH